MWSFSLFLSSFKMFFLETTICVSGLNSHLTSTSSTLTLSFRFILSDMPGIPLQMLHSSMQSSTSLSKSSPFVLWLGKTVFSLGRVFILFLSFALPSTDHLIRPTP